MNDFNRGHTSTSRSMIPFIVVWLGQLVSVVGSGLTSFALGVWVFQRTGSATEFAIIGLSAVVPRVMLSPLAGAVVDRWDRRRVMIVSDVGAALCTGLLAVLLSMGGLETWQIYLVSAASAAFSTLQWPAYAAATTSLVAEKDLGRANGMIQLGQAAGEILAPTLAGSLLGIAGLQAVILIDLATFCFAVASLLLVQFPQARGAEQTRVESATLLTEMTVGWTYIAARPGLRGLLRFQTAVNFLWGMVGALITPMILGFTSSEALGLIISIAGLGMLAGSLVMSIWGGPRRRINGVLGFEFLSGLCFLLIGLRPSFWPVALGAFGAHVTIAIVYGSNQAIWQSRVAPGVQGRVFATQQMVARAASPLAYALAGPLADRVFEPLLGSGGPLAGSFGRILGTGPGRGIGLLFLVMGLLKMAIPILAYADLDVRRIEHQLPSADREHANAGDWRFSQAVAEPPVSGPAGYGDSTTTGR
jgi:MFS family permease